MGNPSEDTVVIKQKKTSHYDFIKAFIAILVLMLIALFDKEHKWITLLLLIFSGILTLMIFILWIAKRPYRLTLTHEGFQLGSNKARLKKWRDIETFQIYRDQVTWTFTPSYNAKNILHKINKRIFGFDDNLPSGYEIEPEELFVLLNEWKERYTKGVGSNIVQFSREYIDVNPASFKSFGLIKMSLFFHLLFMFIILPLVLVFMIIITWEISFSHKLFIWLTALIIFIVILFTFLNQRKNYVSKIIIDDKGITFHGLLKKIYARWDEIKSVMLCSRFMVEVKTRNGNFRFPLTMKDKYKPYRRMRKLLEYKSLIGGLKWIDAQGNEYPITPENCPLYVEIQKHLGNK